MLLKSQIILGGFPAPRLTPMWSSGSTSQISKPNPIQHFLFVCPLSWNMQPAVIQRLDTESFFVSSLLDDFMLLLCASLQRQVFDEENKAAVRLMAGDNVEICRDLDAASFSVHNPVPDFIHCRCSGSHWNPIRI